VILQGFEIENWSCIRKFSVADLPPTGVIVLHGRNRTGKSSLVHALRACLMDYASNSASAALKAWFPRGTAEKPIVTVTFNAGGTIYRVRKFFGTSKTELATRTPTGAWSETPISATEAHRRVCDLVGGDDSSKGLQQLLWLTQGEFHLPDPKKLDGVHQRLRDVLGILQTPLDDRFLERVRMRWNAWFTGQRRPDKQPRIKESSRLSEYTNELAKAVAELKESDAKFEEVESLIRRSSDLEMGKHDLRRTLADHQRAFEQCQAERERCHARLAARRLAKERSVHAAKELSAALEEQTLRAEAAQRLLESESKVEPAQRAVDSSFQAVQSAAAALARLARDLEKHRDKRGEMQRRAERIDKKLLALDYEANLKIARQSYEHAKAIEDEIQNAQNHLKDHPAPDDAILKLLKTNRQAAAQLRAEVEAASISMTLIPRPDAVDAELEIDGAAQAKVPSADGEVTQSVRRKAEIRIANWGRIEIRRGAGTDDLDKMERKLRKLHEDFASAIAPYGISSNDPSAIDVLMQRAVEHDHRRNQIAERTKTLNKLAPKGVTPLHSRVIELETTLADLAKKTADGSDSLPTERADLEKLASQLKEEVEEIGRATQSVERQHAIHQKALDQVRHTEAAAREEWATCKATVTTRREELARLRSSEQIAARVAAARRAGEEAEQHLKESELTPEEATMDDRLAACHEAVLALEKQIREIEDECHRIKGRLEESEGLHSRRAALAARVDELTRLSAAQALERDAVDRLYELFEQCREKQLSTFVGPIQERVLAWMHSLNLGDYKEVRFSPAFLPDKLIRRDGTAEFALDEESTGAQEQIGMLVRLALGSLLATPDEPAVAILDDPLTHCDFGRLNMMRRILRRAAEGASQMNPPAGPLQIIILTCHPEWFRDEQASVIDLESSGVLQRYAD
jgi:DNA repair exonuclease SbcCD ATPase subunit